MPHCMKMFLTQSGEVRQLHLVPGNNRPPMQDAWCKTGNRKCTLTRNSIVFGSMLSGNLVSDTAHSQSISPGIGVPRSIFACLQLAQLFGGHPGCTFAIVRLRWSFYSILKRKVILCIESNCKNTLPYFKLLFDEIHQSKVGLKSTVRSQAQTMLKGATEILREDLIKT